MRHTDKGADAFPTSNTFNNKNHQHKSSNLPQFSAVVLLEVWGSRKQMSQLVSKGSNG